MGLLPIIPICLMNKRISDTVFITFASLATIVAIYHLIGVFYKLNTSPAWRHLIFIGINIICIYGLLKRPLWFIYFFALLLAQQLYSHGGDLIWHWRNEHRVDWISVAVIILMPVIFILLLLARRKW